MAKIVPMKKPPLKIKPSQHFFLRAIQRNIDDLAGIDSLVGKLCQLKVGEEIGIEVNNTVFIAVRTSVDEAVIKTVFKRRG